MLDFVNLIIVILVLLCVVGLVVGFARAILDWFGDHLANRETEVWSKGGSNPRRREDLFNASARIGYIYNQGRFCIYLAGGSVTNTPD